MNKASEILKDPETVNSLLEVLTAAQALYAFIGGEHVELGKAIGNVTYLMQAIEESSEEE